MENTVKKVNVRVGDTVLVLAGNYKGKKGKIISVDPETNTCKMEGAINISNVQIICGKCGHATRVGHKIENDVKHRVCRKCGNILDKKFVKAKAKDAEAQEAVAAKKEEVAKKPLQRREVKHVAESTIKKPAAKKAEATATAKGGK